MVSLEDDKGRTLCLLVDDREALAGLWVGKR